MSEPRNEMTPTEIYMLGERASYVHMAFLMGREQSSDMMLSSECAKSFPGITSDPELFKAFCAGWEEGLADDDIEGTRPLDPK